MKKLLYSVLAFAAILAGSTACQREQKVDVDDANIVDVNFSVGLSGMQTKADASFMGDGSAVNNLKVLVYADGTKYLEKTSIDKANAFKEGLSEKVSLKLVKGQKYTIVFWAQNAAAPYTIDAKTGVLSVKTDGLLANDDKQDAFYAVENFAVNNAGIDLTVPLKRPFAQVNLITPLEDWQAALDNEVLFVGSDMTVKAPTQLNLLSGKVDAIKEITFAQNGIVKPNVPGPVGQCVAANYVLAGEKSDLDKVSFTIYCAAGQLGNPIEVASVPFQRNYRTNIVGAVFCVNGNFTVTLQPEFDGAEDVDPSVPTQTVTATQVADAFAGTEYASVDATTGAITVPDGEENVLDFSKVKSENGYFPSSFASSNPEVGVFSDDPEKVGTFIPVGPGETDVTLHYDAVPATKADDLAYRATNVTFKVKVAGSAFTTVAELNALLTKDAAELKGELTNAVVSFVPATNQAIIKDATGSILFYKKNHGLKQGQTFSGKLTVTAVLYNELYSEITALDAVFEGEEAAVDPEVVTLAQLAGNYAKYQNAYVKVSGMTVTKVDKKNITVTDGENEYVVFCQFGNSTNEAGQQITAKGTVTKYNTTEEIKVWTANAIEVEETVVTKVLAVAEVEHGTISATIEGVDTIVIEGAEENVEVGKNVTLTAEADENYEFDSWVLTNAAGQPLDLAVVGGVFAMPEDTDVVVSAIFNEKAAEPVDNDGSAEHPYTVAEALAIIDAMENGAVAENAVYVSGVISSITDLNTGYGNATYLMADPDDGTSTITVYRGKYLGGQRFTAEGQIKAEDEVVVVGKLQKYVKNEVVTPEIYTGSSIYSLNGDTTVPDPVAYKIAVTTKPTKLEYKVNEAFDPTGMVVTATLSDESTKELAAEEYSCDAPEQFTEAGSVKITVKLLANESLTANFNVTVTAGDQPGGDPGEGVEISFDQAELAAAAAGGASVAMDEVISFTNSSSYGSTVVTEMRVYKNQTLTISAASGYKITKIEITCTANGTAKWGPGAWGAGAPEGYTFDAEGPNGVWTGSASSVAFTATDNQVRIAALKVTYVAETK